MAGSVSRGVSRIPKKIQETRTNHGPYGRRAASTTTNYRQRNIASHKKTIKQRNKERRNALSEEARLTLDRVLNQPAMSASATGDGTTAEDEGWEDNDEMDQENGTMDLGEVLGGRAAMGISHEGGELAAAMEDYRQQYQGVNTTEDDRDRHDRTSRRVAAFERNTGSMARALMAWELTCDAINHPTGFLTKSEPPSSRSSADERDTTEDSSPDSPPPSPPTSHPTFLYDAREGQILDLNHFWQPQPIYLPTQRDSTLAEYVRLGLIPTAPVRPTVFFTARTMEFYRVAHNRAPRFSIQPFVRTICDLQGVVFRPYYSTLFSVAFDTYLALRQIIARHVALALGQDDPDFRLKNTCPACMYQLEDEPDLRLDMLFTMDGNDSLKRMKPASNPGQPVRQVYDDNRDVDTRYYIPRDDVDKWHNVEAEDVQSSPPSIDAPCEDRWTNMQPDSSKLTWSVFDETGIFLSLCEHCFVLTIADMVGGGEASKYALATVEKLVTTFDGRLGGGYDIGCKNIKTLMRSTLGPVLDETGYHALVGAFHGHGHCRKCQLLFLATYCKHIGLADLENCERFFSKSNHLAGSTRSASRFHRKQAIVEYAEHSDDFDIYPALAKYLLDNYKQARRLLTSGPSDLTKLLHAVQQRFPDLNVTEADIPGWLDAERAYFQDLQNKPAADTQEIDYHQALLKLEACEVERARVGDVWNNVTAADLMSQTDQTRAIETRRRHTIESWEHAAAVVHSLEAKFDAFQPRWTPDDPRRAAAAEKIRLREYRECLDKLEALVVARLFELTKTNQSQTGYRLRKHIATALQRRSSAINTAVGKYNDAARAIGRPELDFQQVIAFAFLAEFDILRETRNGIQEQPWASPSGRQAMDLHYKMERAREEIVRVQVHARRLTTYMTHRDAHIRACVATTQTTDPPLAHQILRFAAIRGRATADLHSTLQDLSVQPGFTGTMTPGRRRQPGVVPHGRANDISDAGAEGHPEVPEVPEIGANTLTEDLQEAENDGLAADQEVEQLENFLRVFSLADTW